ncbi:energy transducer TonB [Halarcobacter sp.]|uniref:energy transducer TonB n=1 Tax=Halarcobacter sp. TaxID=2321133 RepID=UPI0029F52540|nr:energy transducer TonB [Halarcobacter sp.]
MISKFILIVSISFVLFIHFTILNNQKPIKKEVVVSKPTTISKISFQKVVIKKQKPKKIEKKKELKKVVKKPIKKDFKKIVENSKNKVLKKVPEKKLVKKEEVKKEKKLVKKQEPKTAPSVMKKVAIVKPQKQLISNEKKDFIENEYLSKLRDLIEKNKTYPKRAKRLKQEGKVLISFEILKDGTIKKINLKDPSRFKRLNNAALDLLKKINRFQPIPKELEKSSWIIDIPISYSIYNS